MEPLSDELRKQAVSTDRRSRLTVLQSAAGIGPNLGIHIAAERIPAAKLHRGDEEHMQGVFERLKPNEMAALIVGLDSLTAALLESSRERGLQVDPDAVGVPAAEVDEETSTDAGGLSEEGGNG